jgi:acetylornithine deacetylase
MNQKNTMGLPSTRDQNFLTEKLLNRLVSIPSVNPEMDRESKGEFEICNFLAEELERLGMHSEFQKIRESSDFGLKRQNLIVNLRLRSQRKNTSSRILMFNGHVDTVPAKSMSIDPFKPKIRDGFLYGRGSSDMKGGIVAAISAAYSLVHSNQDTNGDLILSFVVGEEYHSPGIESLVSKYRADAAIVGEPTNLELGLAVKGFTHAEVEIFGKPAHGSVPELGVDSIEKMSKLVILLKTELQKELSKKVHPLAGYPRVHPSMIQGGVTWNVIPDYCKLQLERRTIPGESSGLFLKELGNLLKKVKREEKEKSQTKFETKLTQVFERSPMETSEKENIVKAAKGAYNQVLQQSKPRIVCTPYWCDAGYLSSVAKIPSIILGPGRVEEAHTSMEKVELSQVVLAAELYKETATRFFNMGP